jgi:hypothetical protein
VSTAGSIHDITSERVIYSKALLSLRVSGLFFFRDCWFVAFENIATAKGTALEGEKVQK